LSIGLVRRRGLHNRFRGAAETGDARGRPLAAGGVASTPPYSGLTHRSEPLPRHRIALPFLLIFEAVPVLTKWKPVRLRLEGEPDGAHTVVVEEFVEDRAYCHQASEFLTSCAYLGDADPGVLDLCRRLLG
jgi:hypothetical protein